MASAQALSSPGPAPAPPREPRSRSASPGASGPQALGSGRALGLTLLQLWQAGVLFGGSRGL